MKRLILYSLSAMLLAAACSNSEPLAPMQITGFHLSSATPATLAHWYSSNLDFDIEENNKATVLSKGSMTIQLEKSEFSSLPVASRKRQPGFFKIGFKTPNLDLLFARLKANGSDFRGEIFHDDHLKMRSLVARDADGNRVQFFEDKTIDSLQPYFFSIIVIDFEQTKAWVESNMGFTELHRLDLPARGFLIRLMKKDGLLLEIISDDKVDSVSQPLPGIIGIVFNRSEHSKGSGELRYNGL